MCYNIINCLGVNEIFKLIFNRKELKTISRKPRNISDTHFFHAMVQGIEKRFIFDDFINMNKYLYLIQKNAKKNNIAIFSYCIMHNHAHLLIKVNNVNDMTKFFSCVNTAYAKFFNSKNNRVGYVFRDRYKTENIYTLKQFINTINYIHDNPIKANLCEKRSDYEFSSYNEYFGQKKIISKKSLIMKFGKNNFNLFFKEEN